MLNNMFSSFDSKNFIMFSYLMLNIMLIKMISNIFVLDKMIMLLKNMILFIYYNISKNFFFLILFIFIFFLNFFSLNMYMYNLTSQFSLNMMMIFSLWMPLLMISLTKKNNHFLTHLLPLGTTTVLMPMMILIELLSFFIRPLTLFLRLTINMIAGHVLVSLISINSMNSSMFYMIILYSYMIMKFLVSFIQSYIINTLLNLYIEEIYVKYKFFFN